MKLRLLLYFILFTDSMFAQKTNVDSLLRIWKNESFADTIRLKALDDLAWDGYLFSNPDSAFYYAQLEYNYAEKKNQKI